MKILALLATILIVGFVSTANAGIVEDVRRWKQNQYQQETADIYAMPQAINTIVYTRQQAYQMQLAQINAQIAMRQAEAEAQAAEQAEYDARQRAAEEAERQRLAHEREILLAKIKNLQQALLPIEDMRKDLIEGFTLFINSERDTKATTVFGPYNLILKSSPHQDFHVAAERFKRGGETAESLIDYDGKTDQIKRYYKSAFARLTSSVEHNYNFYKWGPIFWKGNAEFDKWRSEMLLGLEDAIRALESYKIFMNNEVSEINGSKTIAEDTEKVMNHDIEFLKQMVKYCVESGGTDTYSATENVTTAP